MRPESNGIDEWLPEEYVDRHRFASTMREALDNIYSQSENLYTGIRRYSELRGDYASTVYVYV